MQIDLKADLIAAALAVEAAASPTALDSAMAELRRAARSYRHHQQECEQDLREDAEYCRAVGL